MANEIFSRAANPYLQDFSSSPTSLLDLKIEKLRNRKIEKINKLAPPPDINEVTSRFSADNYLDNLAGLAGSSILREKENIGNLITGQSNPNRLAESDIAAGVNPNVRRELQTDQAEVIQNLADARIAFEDDDYVGLAGNTLSAIKNTAMIAPELAADSAGSITSGVVGTAATATGIGTIGGAALLLKKGNTVKNIFEGIQKSVDTAVKAKRANKAGKKLDVLEKALVKVKLLGKRTSQTSVMTAGIMQEMEEDYIEEHGEASSFQHKAVNAPIAIALNIAQFQIFKKFYLPSKKGLVRDGNAVKKYVQEMTEVLNKVPKSYSKQVAKRVLGNVNRIKNAAGAEAAQEYFQTWHEILAAKMDDASLASAMKELKEGGNIDQSFFGFLAGAGAGAVFKGVTSAPGLATGVALDTAAGTIQSTAQFAKEKSIAASLKVLSEGERADIKKVHDKELAIFEQFKTKKKAQVDELKAAKTVSDIKDTELLEEFTQIQEKRNITDESLKDPKQFKQVTDRIAASYEALIVQAREKVRFTDAGRVVAQSAKNITKGTLETVKKAAETVLTPENIEKVVQIATDVSEAAVEAAKNIKSSAGVGLVINASEYTGELTFKQGNQLKRMAQSTDLKELKAATKILQNPAVTRILDRTIAQKTKILTELRDTVKTEVNKDNLSPLIKKLVKSGDPITVENAPVIARELHNAISNSRIADNETIKALKRTIRKYEKSDVFKKQEETGVISKADMRSLRNQLQEHSDKINRVGNAVKVARVAGKAAIKAGKIVSKKAVALSKKGFEAAKEKVVPAVTEGVKAVQTYADDNKQAIEESIDNLGELADTAIGKFEKTIDSLSQKQHARTVKSIDDNLKTPEDIGPTLEKLTPELLLNIIDSGIQTKEDFIEFLKTAAPRLSATENKGKSLAGVVADNIFEPVLKTYQEEQAKQTTTGETATSEDVPVEESTATVEEQMAVNDHINDDDSVAVTDKVYSASEAAVIADESGIKLC